MAHQAPSSAASRRSQQTARLERSLSLPRRAHTLLRTLEGRRNILVTTHEHPDPDALAAAIGMSQFLLVALPDAEATVSFKGRIGGGLNTIFAHYSGRHTEKWEEQALPGYDAIVLLDCQPTFTNSPLPQALAPTAVIDHHPRIRGHPFTAPFVDVRRNIGAACSIVYAYFHEMNLPVAPDVAALMLFGIESDLAGVAGQPSQLDHHALSNLMLLADSRAYHAIKYADIPRSYFVSYYQALTNALLYGPAMITYLGVVDSPEQPAVIADLLLRCEGIDSVLVAAVHDGSLLLSLRTFSPDIPAGKLMTRLVRSLGEGGGHPTKGGGAVPLRTSSPAEITGHMATIRRRLLRCLDIHTRQPTPLLPQSVASLRN